MVTKGKMLLEYLSPMWPSMVRVRNWWNQSRRLRDRRISNRNERVMDFVAYIDGVTDVYIGMNTAFISRICVCICVCICSCGIFTTKYISLCKSVSSQQHLIFFFYFVCKYSKVRFQIMVYLNPYVSLETDSVFLSQRGGNRVTLNTERCRLIAVRNVLRPYKTN